MGKFLIIILSFLSHLAIGQIHYPFAKSCEDLEQLDECTKHKIFDAIGAFQDSTIIYFDILVKQSGLLTIENATAYPEQQTSDVEIALKNITRNLVFEPMSIDSNKMESTIQIQCLSTKEKITGSINYVNEPFREKEFLLEAEAALELCDHIPNETGRAICSQRELNEFLHSNIRFPSILKQFDISGQMDIWYLIDDSSEIVEVHISKDELGFGVSDQVKALFNIAPKFVPAVAENRFVASWQKISLYYRP